MVRRNSAGVSLDAFGRPEWWRKKAPHSNPQLKCEWRAWNALAHGAYRIADGYIHAWRIRNAKGPRLADPFLKIEELAARHRDKVAFALDAPVKPHALKIVPKAQRPIDPPE